MTTTMTNEEVLVYAYQQRYNQKMMKPIELDTPAQRRAMKRILITYIAQNAYTDDKQTPDYPYNLIETIYQGDIDFENWTQDNIDGLEIALSGLSERERKVLELRYKDGLILDETAKHFNVTRERIRQVEIKAIRKLRHPSRSKWFLKGKSGCDLAYYEKIKDEQERDYKAACDYVLSEIKNDREKLVAALSDLDARLGNEIDYSVPRHTFEEIAGNVKIEDVPFSVRTFNCLSRHGVKRLFDITQMTEADLKKVRNLGKKSIDEVKAILKENGLDLKEE